MDWVALIEEADSQLTGGERKEAFRLLIKRRRVVGTLDEACVFARWDAEEGILDPATLVYDVMREDILPDIPASAAVAEARRRFKEAGTAAFLIPNARKPITIVTKFDLLQHLE